MSRAGDGAVSALLREAEAHLRGAAARLSGAQGPGAEWTAAAQVCAALTLVREALLNLALARTNPAGEEGRGWPTA